MSDVIVEYLCPPCVWCTKQEPVGITEDEYDAWVVARKHVQHAFPTRDADFREMILTGTHPECWDSMFGDED